MTGTQEFRDRNLRTSRHGDVNSQTQSYGYRLDIGTKTQAHFWKDQDRNKET